MKICETKTVQVQGFSVEGANTLVFDSVALVNELDGLMNSKSYDALSKYARVRRDRLSDGRAFLQNQLPKLSLSIASVQHCLDADNEFSVSLTAVNNSSDQELSMLMDIESKLHDNLKRFDEKFKSLKLIR